MKSADIENGAPETHSGQRFEAEAKQQIPEGSGGKTHGLGAINGLLAKVAQHGAVELGGSVPVPYKERTVTQYVNIFSLWFSLSCNLLPYVYSNLFANFMSFGC
jgi:hypothetical protein